MLKQYKRMGSAIALSLMVSAANAGVSSADAAKIGTTLTPMGAEKAGSAEVTAWTGGVTTPPAGYTVGSKHVNPFAADKISTWLKGEPKILNTISACVLLIIAIYVAATQHF